MVLVGTRFEAAEESEVRRLEGVSGRIGLMERSARHESRREGPL